MGLGIPPVEIKIMLESNPLKSIMFSTRIGRSFLMPCQRVRGQGGRQGVRRGTEHLWRVGAPLKAKSLTPYSTCGHVSDK